jgi:hypothetical protein
MPAAHAPYTEETLRVLKYFDDLPDDAVVPLRMSRMLRGNVSKWTDNRNPPPLRTIRISSGRLGHRVGDLRALVRGLRGRKAAA